MRLPWLRPRPGFAHGVAVPAHKEQTLDAPIRQFPFAPRLFVPLSQHAGRPAIAVVDAGAEVVRGQLLGAADGEFSVPVHAPASGRVTARTLVRTAAGTRVPGLVLEPWPGSTQEVLEGTPCPLDAAPATILAAVRDAGIVGLGGAAFPTHVKLRTALEAGVDTLIVNGVECEPRLTSDYRVMLEQTADLLTGVRYLTRLLGGPRVLVAVETHYHAAAERVRVAAAEAGVALEVVELPVKYPQGAEKVLLRTLLGREVPSGGLPSDVDATCVNVATAAEIGRLLPHGRGIQERIVTLAGPALARPGNYRMAIGTPLRFALEQAGAGDDLARVFVGGPMMGQAVADLDAPITKGIGGLVAFTAAETKPQVEYPCIHCGACVDACPLFLNPFELGRHARAGEHAAMAERYHLADCFECGACSYVCPSHIPLVQEFRAAKAALRREAVA
jgi:electron transport complex protein RnfC